MTPTVGVIVVMDVGRLAGNGVALHGPIAKIDLLAAPGAEGPERGLFAPFHGLFAGGAVDG